MKHFVFYENRLLIAEPQAAHNRLTQGQAVPSHNFKQWNFPFLASSSVNVIQWLSHVMRATCLTYLSFLDLTTLINICSEHKSRMQSLWNSLSFSATSSMFGRNTLPHYLTIWSPAIMIPPDVACRSSAVYTQCICMFCVDLRTNSHYFPIQH